MSRYDDDEDDDRPRRRRRDRDDDEDDGPSRASRRRGDDVRDDYDDLPPRRRAEPGKGLAITAMIIGIVAVVTAVTGWCCCGVFGSVGSAVVGLVAVILGFVSRSQGSRSGMGLAGIITGFAALLIGIVLTILLLVGVAFMQMNQGKFGPGGAGGGPGGGGGMQRKGF